MKKTAQLQIRVTEEQKEILRVASREANMGISEYVLAKLFDERKTRFSLIVEKVLKAENHSFALAELNDFLTELPADIFTSTLREKPALDFDTGLFRSNYITAMVEFAAAKKGVTNPDWAAHVPILKTPFFSSNMTSLRLHLLQNSPAAFKRRNIFIDSTIGDRV